MLFNLFYFIYLCLFLFFFFLDPREWSKEQVGTWLRLLADKHKIDDLQLDRFRMNGKALCLMNINMFNSRVPTAGKILYRDFKTRLNRALAREAPTRSTNNLARIAVTSTVRKSKSTETITSPPAGSSKKVTIHSSSASGSPSSTDTEEIKVV